MEERLKKAWERSDRIQELTEELERDIIGIEESLSLDDDIREDIEDALSEIKRCSLRAACCCFSMALANRKFKK